MIDGKLSILCDCDCTVAVFEDITFKDDDPPHVYVEFYTQDTRFTLRSRIARAWNVLLDREARRHDLILTAPTLRQLQAYCHDVLARYGENGKPDIKELAAEHDKREVVPDTGGGLEGEVNPL